MNDSSSSQVAASTDLSSETSAAAEPSDSDWGALPILTTEIDIPKPKPIPNLEDHPRRFAELNEQFAAVQIRIGASKNRGTMNLYITAAAKVSELLDQYKTRQTTTLLRHESDKSAERISNQTYPGIGKTLAPPSQPTLSAPPESNEPKRTLANLPTEPKLTLYKTSLGIGNTIALSRASLALDRIRALASTSTQTYANVLEAVFSTSFIAHDPTKAFHSRSRLQSTRSRSISTTTSYSTAAPSLSTNSITTYTEVTFAAFSTTFIAHNPVEALATIQALPRLFVFKIQKIKVLDISIENANQVTSFPYGLQNTLCLKKIELCFRAEYATRQLAAFMSFLRNLPRGTRVVVSNDIDGELRKQAERVLVSSANRNAMLRFIARDPTEARLTLASLPRTFLPKIRKIEVVDITHTNTVEVQAFLNGLISVLCLKTMVRHFRADYAHHLAANPHQLDSFMRSLRNLPRHMRVAVRNDVNNRLRMKAESVLIAGPDVSNMMRFHRAFRWPAWKIGVFNDAFR
ncbi:hypothetical protein PRZ48_010258 [Zasmidium cellare]|uniref:Uncharacterized protein n=1 Tax=Zasmidium cellare TaxID=395010 RepID=A0ABR0E8N9_ZASCE|nr:hypothetical protein PRZ48_010258 [Zasmidium cellare]